MISGKRIKTEIDKDLSQCISKQFYLYILLYDKLKYY